MMIVMEMSSGRMLGAASSHDLDTYDEEALNAAWAAASRSETRLQEVVAASVRKPALTDVAGFMAHLCLNQQ